MPDGNNQNAENLVFYLVNDPVIANPYPVRIFIPF
jgi:hypothetical protein